MYFQVCECCGAALDPGERCDCNAGSSAAIGGAADSFPVPEVNISRNVEAASSLIRVAQLPVIEEHLRSMKDAVDVRVAQSLSLVCTADTVQAVKNERAELRRQFDELEDRRKVVKAAVLGPYNQFEAVYRECVSDAFKSADTALKRKIDAVEAEIKKQCEDGLRDYFGELCLAHHIDFLRFEQAGIKVDMTIAKQKTPKKPREQLVQFVARVAQDVDRIAEMDDAEEVMLEYKKTLNVADSIGIVLNRHRRIEEERAARAARNAAQAAEAEAVKKVDAAAPAAAERPVERPAKQPKEDPVYDRFTFTAVNVRRSELIKIRNFMDQEGIRYE